MQDDSDVFAYLEPLTPSPGVSTIYFTEGAKRTRQITIGRSPSNNHVLHGLAVSGEHAIIQWNGRRDMLSVVTITDSSINGTFVDGERVETQVATQLFNGCTVCFGSKVPVVTEEADYRYKFHHAFGRSKTEAIYSYFTFGNELGKGGFGTVHKATEKKSGRSFAIKTVWTSSKQEHAITCAGQEAMAMMVLHHPNICKLHEVFFHMNGLLVDIILEYIDGLTLERFMEGVSFSEVQAKELSFQICDAIGYMHHQGVSHGDVKPNNILIAGYNRPVIKVADFGLARVRGKLNMPQVVTDLRWTAPEAHEQVVQYTGDVHVAMCMMWDGWAVGCIVYELLSRQEPFTAREHSPGFRVGEDEIMWGRLDLHSLVVQDFVRRLLVPDPSARISVGAALEHPWLAGHVPYQVSFEGIPFWKPPPSPESSTFEKGREHEFNSDEDMDMDMNGDGGAGLASKRLQPARRTGAERMRSKPGPGTLDGRPKRGAGKR
ncbi:kinase-like domain-containing protein [Mycena latifolia]|nr:kinase-like domain-containing protein [Mycena latifolia]